MALACFFHANGQRCGTDEPDLTNSYHQWFNRLQAEQSYEKVNALRIIPVAVHVIYCRQSVAHNISDAQIQSQINILNDDFRGRSGGVDMDIEFCLAGIERIRSREHHEVQKGTNDVQAKALSQADPARYLNIWVVDELKNENSNNILGFAQFPIDFAASPATDGVMIQDDYFGNIGTAAGSAPYNLGRTTTHEVGHWLNLLHTHSPPGCDDSWTCARIGDCCCDTPPQSNPSFGCNTGLNSCSTDQPDLPDPVENYLCYSDDVCMSMFTACQSTRANLCLDVTRMDAWILDGDCPPFKRSPLAEAGLGVDELLVVPQPVKGNFQCRFSMAEAGEVVVRVYDLQGRLEVVLFEGWLGEGKHSLQFSERLVRELHLLEVVSERRVLRERVVWW